MRKLIEKVCMRLIWNSYTVVRSLIKWYGNHSCRRWQSLLCPIITNNQKELFTHNQRTKVIKSNYASRSASEKRRRALKSCVSKFLRNSHLLQSITDSTYLHADFPMWYSETQKRFSCLCFFIIDLFIVLSFLYVIGFSLHREAEKFKRSELTIKVMRDKKHKRMSSDNLCYTLTMMIMNQLT